MAESSSESISEEKSLRYRRMVLGAVESLLGEGVSKEIMEESCSLLDVGSFADVAEERAVSKLCGYPPCASSLQEKSWPKYRIVRNKVFDTAERRRFCSDQCYERFVHVRKQLPDVPLWFRGTDSTTEPFRLTFLENESQSNRRGLPGQELELPTDDLADALGEIKLEDEIKET